MLGGKVDGTGSIFGSGIRFGGLVSGAVVVVGLGSGVGLPGPMMGIG